MNQYNIWNQSSNHPHYNGWYQTEQQQQQQHQQHQQHQQQQLRPQQQQNNGNQQDTPLSPDLLINKLNNLSNSSNYNNFLQSLESQQNGGVGGAGQYLPDQLPSYNNNVFNLPLELQGGVSNISSRRPSFTAEQLYTTNPTNGGGNNLNLLAHQNNFNNFYNNTSGQQNQLLQNFRSRRPSIQINNGSSQVPNNGNEGGNKNLELDNGLILNGNLIITSPILQNEYSKTKNYFALESSEKLYKEILSNISTNEFLKKIIINLKKLNNLFNLIKPLVLVLTKAGKFEILSTPINSNILLQKNDVVIVDGDRGKDLVYILDPAITLDVAILINYLKKRQHSKSMNYGQQQQVQQPLISNTVDDLIKGQGILDEETQFQIPNKQVLRFATFQEIKNLKFKLIEELKSFKTSILKISNLSNLNGNLTILNSEYQFDQKKLTFFYFANQRLDFRNLIKELFKIYKTRIWLCAVPKPPNFNNNNYNNNSNEIMTDVDDIDGYKIDDFHVCNFQVTLNELMR